MMYLLNEGNFQTTTLDSQIPPVQKLWNSFQVRHLSHGPGKRCTVKKVSNVKVSYTWITL